MKAVMVILDGIADRSYGELGWVTPLEAATTPNLDRVAVAGSCGHMYSAGPGICTSSDIAMWHILGYSSYPFPGRAAIEALGDGISLNPGEVMVAANMASTVMDGGARYVQAAPAYLPDEQAAEIAASLAEYKGEYFGFKLHHIGGPFMFAVLDGGASPLVTDSDPLFYRLPVMPIMPMEASGIDAKETAAELEFFSSWAAGIMKEHPVNSKRIEEGMTTVDYVLTKWPSTSVCVPSFETTTGLKAVVAASGAFYRGLSGAFEMEMRDVNEADPSEDLRQKVDTALDALDDGFDFALIHTKEPDEVSHAGKPGKKVECIEKLDSALERLVEVSESRGDTVVLITADHPTPSGGSDAVKHSGESVPLVIAGKNARVDRVESFDELSCTCGSIGQISGDDVMRLVLNAMDRCRFGDSRLIPRDVPYRPVG